MSILNRMLLGHKVAPWQTRGALVGSLEPLDCPSSNSFWISRDQQGAEGVCQQLFGLDRSHTNEISNSTKLFLQQDPKNMLKMLSQKKYLGVFAL